MSSIRQYQRRALEALKPKEIQSIYLLNTDEFYLNDEKIFLVGISRGVGTCSDLHNINIAVFSRIKPENNQTPLRPTLEILCAWSALLRDLTETELQEELNDKKDISHLTVERIEPILLIENNDVRTYYFQSTNQKEFYVNTIT